jgi:polysaccharide export outer membrane protein
MLARQKEFMGRGFAVALKGTILLAAAVIALAGCNGVPGDGHELPSQRAAQHETGPENNAALARVASEHLAASTPGNAGYLVGPQDVLDVTVYQAPDLTKTVQVAEDGAINLPLLGQVSAAGKSPSRLEKEIQGRLNARYMKSAQVTVFVKEYNSQRVTVEGSVKNPGVFPLRGDETLMQVIAKSGGLDRERASSDVVIFRTADGVRTATRFDISAIHGGSEQDPRVLPGDVIVVADSTAKTGLSLFLRVLPVAGYAVPLF